MSQRTITPRLQINARMVKEKDRARARELRKLAIYGAAIVVPLLVYVWQRVEFLRVSYRVEALKKERGDLQEQNKRLVVERSFLLSPDRIERLARHDLGLVDPPPGDVRRVAVIDGHINEVDASAASAPGGDAPGARAAAGAASGDAGARATPGRPAAKGPRHGRGRKPAPAPKAPPSDQPAVEAGVGALPAVGTVTPHQDDDKP